MSGPTRSVWPQLLALALLSAVLAWTLGSIGVVVALVTIAGWLGHSLPFGIAGGHVALVALAATAIDPLTFVAVEGAFVLWLLADVRPWGWATVAALSAVAGLGGVTWFALASGPLWLAGLTLLFAMALASYAIHRLALVRFGLVADADAIDRTAAPTDRPTDTTSDP